MKYQQLMKQYYGDINNLSQLLQSMVNSYRLLIAGAAELNNINEAKSSYVKVAVKRADSLSNIIDHIIDLIDECMVFGMPDEVDKNDVKLSVKVVYNKDEVKQKYGDISFDEIRDIIWNRIKNEVNTTVPRYKHIMNMILTDKELIKTTTKKVKRNEELKEILGR